MELHVLDPFEDFQTAGYLRNRFQEKDLAIVGRLETAAFREQVQPTLRFLRRVPDLRYEHILETHRRLFEAVYPWAGQDRLENAPHLRIVKAGYRELFALPDSIRVAAEYALQLARDAAYLRAHPGQVLGYLAHAHPFLEGNGRTILTVYAELARRAGFHVLWEEIEKGEFLRTLTEELLRPGSSMDALVLPYVRPGALSVRRAAGGLDVNFGRGR
jgi:cell filamentation protein